MERYREKVWRVCWRLMSAQHDAEDAAQEVFVRLFFERGKFAGRSSYSTWLHGVAIRTCLMLRRSRSRRRRREEPGTAEQIEAHQSRQPETAAAFDASHDVVQLLAGLDEEDRALMLMKFAEGHEYDALAEMFRSTSAALRMRVSRIKERLTSQAGPLTGDCPWIRSTNSPRSMFRRCRLRRPLRPACDGSSIPGCSPSTFSSSRSGPRPGPLCT
jgi:RNA polymerase sigma-70 factor (ECF subfamily)